MYEVLKALQESFQQEICWVFEFMLVSNHHEELLLNILSPYDQYSGNTYVVFIPLYYSKVESVTSFWSLEWSQWNEKINQTQNVSIDVC